ncbi:putative pterin-4-alpha-carbinolamine dehydratase [Nocardioides baekrokdamisoli]|uniref:Putative pterin-4-alpha-carbinolamine dehydratase n=1 Tax=Nocardioides baekrokdamisoli TaxID=1804624 RepID=A0A3G9IRH1_9ACTN|nr:4a-hydroxytetrahydrobiopterin dehydratase [Nocardioides baekrokdamisoli]BBH18565.1 putative pterin-4-alpha-carbinolamine dehydratase [Nocardioides baekrokdamisoli]
MTKPLTPQEIEVAVATLTGWSKVDGMLTRTRTLDTFPAALDWVQMVGGIAEELNHHPDIDIRWCTVTLRICTHDAGNQITAKDVEFAALVDRIGVDAEARSDGRAE